MRRCRYSQCKKPFEPKYSSLQTTCSPECGLGYARESTPERLMRDRERARKAEEREKRGERRKWREANATIPQLKAKADREFGRFIRERDHGQPCICCGEYAKSGEWDNGGVYDAGHYRTKGAADHLRYHEDNAHLQRKYCNKWRSGNQAAYRVRLIAKIGLAKVEALDNDNSTHKWTREELVAIRRKYVAAWKTLRSARQSREAA